MFLDAESAKLSETIDWQYSEMKIFRVVGWLLIFAVTSMSLSRLSFD